MTHISTELQAAIKAATDKKALDLVILDVSEVSTFADNFLIATGTSNRHIRTLVETVEVALKPVVGSPMSIEVMNDARWVLMDYGSLVIHIFDDESRKFYDLQKLWSDATEIEVALTSN